MYNLILTQAEPSAFLGFVFLVLFFALSIIIAVGGKMIFTVLKKLSGEKEQIQTPPPPQPVRKPRRKRPAPKPVRSIEINPEEIDRIYVKKTS